MTIAVTAGMRAKLEATIAEIADVLDRPPAPFDGDKLLEMGLAGGNVGFALFYAYLDRMAPAARWRRIGQRHLRAGLARIPAGSNRPFFSYGFAGAGWTFAHVAGWFGDVGVDALDDIDDALLFLVEQAPTVTYDLQYGLVGFGVYALERLPAPSARRLLEAVIARLARTAESARAGRTWRSVNAVWIESPNLALLERGLYLPSVYNGVAGIVGLLGGAIAAGIATRQAKPLLADALAWVWSRRSLFAESPLNASWCDGGLGAATVCYVAARAAGLDAWQPRWLGVARSIAKAKQRASRITVANGLAGAALMYRRLYELTGEHVFADAATRDIARLLRRRRSGRGLAGFASWVGAWERDYVANGAPVGAVGLPGLLTGVAGIGLVCQAMLHDHDTQWDRALLLSYRPR